MGICHICELKNSCLRDIESYTTVNSVFRKRQRTEQSRPGWRAAGQGADTLYVVGGIERFTIVGSCFDMRSACAKTRSVRAQIANI